MGFSEVVINWLTAFLVRFNPPLVALGLILFSLDLDFVETFRQCLTVDGESRALEHKVL